MTRHYPDLGSASDWLKRAGTSFQPIRSTTKIWVVTRHQYGISVLVTQTSFCEGSSGDLAKRRLFSQAKAETNFPLNQAKSNYKDGSFENRDSFVKDTRLSVLILAKSQAGR